MKKFYLLALSAFSLLPAHALISDSIQIQDKACTIQTLQERPIGPGAVYHRYRVPEFPLNINMVTVDLRNPYVQIETNLPNDRSAGNELLTDAAVRHDSKDHHAIAAQNSNFWVVSSSPVYNVYGAIPYNGAMRNGILASDAREIAHTPTFQGLVSVGPGNKVYIDICNNELTFTTAKLGKREFSTCNSGFRGNQVAIYTPWYGPDKNFVPMQNEGWVRDDNADAYEVMCNIAEGETWMGGRDIRFKVAEVRHTNGCGTLGEYDLALCSRDAALATLEPGDDLSINYSWIFDPDGEAIRPEINQAVGGNMCVMRHGQITEYNYWDGYNTMVYSRSAYGISEDGNTLYMMTIDRSTDLVYGGSVGCVTAEMCDIARHFGAWNLLNVDAGGSAMLMVDGAIINRTTEGNPRAVHNGWMVFNTSPDEDKTVAALEFYDIDLQAPVNAVYTPRVIALNKYGTVLDNDFKDFTVTVDPAIGQAKGSAFQVGPQPGSGLITVTASDGVSCSRTINLVSSDPSLVRSTITIDSKHTYPIEVTTLFERVTYEFNPASVTWTSDRPEIAYVDEQGVLHGVSNGVAVINGKLGAMDQNITVSVENVSEPVSDIHGNWTEWTPKAASGIRNMTMGEDGTLAYTYNSVRGRSWVSLSKAMTLYGLPERVVVEFESTMPVTEVELDLHAFGDDRAKLNYVPETQIEANVPAKVSFEVSEIGDVADVSIYPLAMSTLKVYSPSGSAYKGEQSLKLKSLTVEYSAEQGVDNINAEDRGIMVAPNPVEAGSNFSVSSASPLCSVEIYDMAGRLVSADSAEGNSASLGAPAVAGTYVVRAVASGSAATALLIVR